MVALVFVLLLLCCCVVFGLLLTSCLCLRSYRLLCVCFRFAFVLISFLVDFMLRTWYFLVALLGSRFTTSRSTDDIRRWWGPVVNRRDGGSMPPTAVSKLRQFLHPTFACVFRKRPKNRWSLLSGVYARGSKRSHTGGKCVTCSGLTNSR